MYNNLKKLAGERLYVSPADINTLRTSILQFDSGATDDALKEFINSVFKKWMLENLLKLHA